jgi:cytochrome c oxidase subunit 3
MAGPDTAAPLAAPATGSHGDPPARGPERVVPGRPSILGVGVVVWLASELMFFAGLFATYFTLRAGTDPWPPEDVHLPVLRAAIFTLVLVASSFTMHRAVRAAEHGDRPGLVRWLLVTAGLGALFLANQVLEYIELEFSISSHAYGSMFFIMTGFHGLHVLGGLAFMLGVIALVSGRSKAPPAPPVSVCGYYWHFVDVVWVVMFATIYLLR